ncbi:MAG: tRNA (adenosine(37)-N6)-threonylcarbamoyltransferase complex ATPase subunit type 1 TsaE [Ferrimicrobium sp.]
MFEDHCDTKGVDDTIALGAHVGARLPRGSLILLEGDLGAGKTALCQGLAVGLGVSTRVVSPTFLTMRTYDRVGVDGGGLFLHVDLYRVEDPWYLEEQGVFEELENGAVVAVEWSERAAGCSRYDPLGIQVQVVTFHRRRLRLAGSDRWSSVLLEPA